MFGDKEFLDISKDEALVDLKELFGLKKIPVRIEGFDISHIQGTNVVGSRSYFPNGVSDRSASIVNLKLSSTKMMISIISDEIISRRFSEKNIKRLGQT